jgi:hypothetical protein
MTRLSRSPQSVMICDLFAWIARRGFRSKLITSDWMLRGTGSNREFGMPAIIVRVVASDGFRRGHSSASTFIVSLPVSQGPNLCTTDHTLYPSFSDVGASFSTPSRFVRGREHSHHMARIRPLSPRSQFIAIFVSRIIRFALAPRNPRCGKDSIYSLMWT